MICNVGYSENLVGKNVNARRGTVTLLTQCSVFGGSSIELPDSFFQAMEEAGKAESLAKAPSW